MMCKSFTLPVCILCLPRESQGIAGGVVRLNHSDILVGIHLSTFRNQKISPIMPQECSLLPGDAKGEPISLTELCVSEGM